MQLTSAKTMIPSSIDIIYNTTCINAPLRLEAGILKNSNDNGIVSLVTCCVRNIACIAIKGQQKIDGSVLLGEVQLKRKDNDVK